MTLVMRYQKDTLRFGIPTRTPMHRYTTRSGGGFSRDRSTCQCERDCPRGSAAVKERFLSAGHGLQSDWSTSCGRYLLLVVYLHSTAWALHGRVAANQSLPMTCGARL